MLHLLIEPEVIKDVWSRNVVLFGHMAVVMTCVCVPMCARLFYITGIF